MARDDTVLVRFLKLVPRHEFETDERRHHKGRKLRKMTRRSRFAAVAMGQLSGRCSLRDTVVNVEAQIHRHYHLGVGGVSQSPLARVSGEQPYTLCE